MKDQRVILVLGACAFASGFSMRAVDPIIPLIAAEFGTALTTTSILATAFSLCYALSQPFFGPLGDVFGKPALIVLCGSLLSVAVFACAFAPNFSSLMAFRAVSGLLAGAIIPVAVALISDLSSSEERQIGIARFLMAPILGQMLGAAASGAIAEWIDWRVIFLLTSALVLGSTVAAFFLIGAARTKSQESFGLGAITRRYRAVFRNRRAFQLYGLVLAGGAATFGVFPWVAIILQARTESGAFEAGLVLAGFGIGGVLFGAFIRSVIRIIGPKRMGVLGGTIAGTCMAAFALPLYWAWDMGLFIVLGFFYYMLHNTFQSQVVRLSPEATGSAMSIFALCMFTAQGVGPIFYGLGLGLLPDPVVLLIAGAIIVLAGIAGIRLIAQLEADRAAEQRGA